MARNEENEAMNKRAEGDLQLRQDFNNPPPLSALITPPLPLRMRLRAVRSVAESNSPMTPNTVSSELDRVQDIMDKKIKIDTPIRRKVPPLPKKVVELVREADAITGLTNNQPALPARTINPPARYSPSPFPKGYNPSSSELQLRGLLQKP
jgi:hypothetical protein